MADYPYRQMTEEQKAARRAARAAASATPVVGPELIAAWEADHYEHTLLLAAATDRDVRRSHRRAMRRIEEALFANGGAPAQTVEQP